jgi:hypothetical protein
MGSSTNVLDCGVSTCTAVIFTFFMIDDSPDIPEDNQFHEAAKIETLPDEEDAWGLFRFVA